MGAGRTINSTFLSSGEAAAAGACGRCLSGGAGLAGAAARGAAAAEALGMPSMLAGALAVQQGGATGRSCGAAAGYSATPPVYAGSSHCQQQQQRQQPPQQQASWDHTQASNSYEQHLLSVARPAPATAAAAATHRLSPSTGTAWSAATASGGGGVFACLQPSIALVACHTSAAGAAAAASPAKKRLIGEVSRLADAAGAAAVPGEQYKTSSRPGTTGPGSGTAMDVEVSPDRYQPQTDEPGDTVSDPQRPTASAKKVRFAASVPEDCLDLPCRTGNQPSRHHGLGGWSAAAAAAATAGTTPDHIAPHWRWVGGQARLVPQQQLKQGRLAAAAAAALQPSQACCVMSHGCRCDVGIAAWKSYTLWWAWARPLAAGR
ncbi:hypothetical protein COO60DRAFT_558466 [Scenedesmus sp. NREL 46B-D3]|nr:hypothetical protein COO60DRAFT_558466 [Scenedesmus sp. NREL 46B-D3]